MVGQTFQTIRSFRFQPQLFVLNPAAGMKQTPAEYIREFSARNHWTDSAWIAHTSPMGKFTPQYAQTQS